MTIVRGSKEISDCSSINPLRPCCSNMTKMLPPNSPSEIERPLCKMTSLTWRPWPRRPTPAPSPSCPWQKPPFLVVVKYRKNLMMEISLMKANQNIRSQWKISKKIAEPTEIKMIICPQSIASSWNSKSFAYCSGW